MSLQWVLHNLADMAPLETRGISAGSRVAPQAEAQQAWLPLNALHRLVQTLEAQLDVPPFCSVVGLKPTYGLVSRFGLVSYANSLEQIGPVGRTVSDVVSILNVIAGPMKTIILR